MARTSSAVAVVVLSAGIAAQTVHVVGPGGFAQITQAIAAAANGDVVLVQSGSYLPFTLAKDLTVTAAAGAIVDVIGIPFFGVAPTVLQPPTFAKLAGLRFRVGSLFGFSETRVLGGTVHFADCLFEGWRSSLPTAALMVQNASVAMQRCGVIAWGAVSGIGPGCHGMQMQHATVAAADCMFFGGNFGWDYSPGNGGHAVVVDDSKVQLSACYALGGTNAAVIVSGFPGDGIRVFTPSQVAIADCELHGGHCYGGPGGFALANLAAPAVRVARSLLIGGTGTPAGPASLGALATAPLLGVVATPAIALGAPWSIDYRAAPSTPVLAAWSDRLAPSTAPQLADPAWLASAIGIAATGVTDTSGRLLLTFSVPATPALLHAPFFVQGVAGATLPLEPSVAVGGPVR